MGFIGKISTFPFLSDAQKVVRLSERLSKRYEKLLEKDAEIAELKAIISHVPTEVVNAAHIKRLSAELNLLKQELGRVKSSQTADVITRSLQNRSAF